MLHVPPCFVHQSPCMVMDGSNTGIVGLNPDRGMDVYPRRVFLCCAVCVGRGLAMGRFPVQGVLQKCLKGFIVSEVNCESEQANGLNHETHWSSKLL